MLNSFNKMVNSFSKMVNSFNKMFRFISNVTSDTLVQSRGKFGNGKNMNL